jgi:hypothetical protein
MPVVPANATARLRLKITLPSKEELSFGSELSMDLIIINGKAVLHVIDSATRFNAATFLDLHSESYRQSSAPYDLHLSTYGAPSIQDTQTAFA